jgi:hypothetical protein
MTASSPMQRLRQRSLRRLFLDGQLPDTDRHGHPNGELNCIVPANFARTAAAASDAEAEADANTDAGTVSQGTGGASMIKCPMPCEVNVTPETVGVAGCSLPMAMSPSPNAYCGTRHQLASDTHPVQSTRHPRPIGEFELVMPRWPTRPAHAEISVAIKHAPRCQATPLSPLSTPSTAHYCPNCGERWKNGRAHVHVRTRTTGTPRHRLGRMSSRAFGYHCYCCPESPQHSAFLQHSCRFCSF